MTTAYCESILSGHFSATQKVFHIKENEKEAYVTKILGGVELPPSVDVLQKLPPVDGVLGVLRVPEKVDT